MNQYPLAAQQRAPRTPIIPAIISTVGGVLFLVAIFLPLLSSSYGTGSDSVALADHFFDSGFGGRIWGSVFIVAPLVAVITPWQFIYLAKASREKRATKLKTSVGLMVAFGVVVALFILFLLYLFVIKHGMEVGSYSFSDVAGIPGVSWSVGLYLSLAGFVGMLVGFGLVLPWYQRVKRELFVPFMAGGQQGPGAPQQYGPGQPFGQPGQPYSQAGQPHGPFSGQPTQPAHQQPGQGYQPGDQPQVPSAPSGQQPSGWQGNNAGFDPQRYPNQGQQAPGQPNQGGQWNPHQPGSAS